MNQFLAVLVDALRLLKAKALFWITLGISILAALLYSSIGFDEQGITYLFGAGSLENPLIREGTPLAEMFYLGIFSTVIVGIWLSWVAVILALVTCSPIFPEFMAEGSAGTVLCKPISRLRLFFYKYVSGLLFAILQTAAFSLIVFLAIRWRIGTWNPTVFWAVPLITLMFSYLWSVMVAVGIKTRSVMASLLAALIVWFGAWVAKFAEDLAWNMAETGTVPTSQGSMPLSEAEKQQWKERYPTMASAYRLFPKTSDTVGLLNRYITVEGSRDFSMSQLINAISTGEANRDEEMEQALARHSPFFIISSSLAFEAVFMGFAAWSFCRRDF